MIPADQLMAARDYARPMVKQVLRNFPDDVEDALSDATVSVIRANNYRGDSAFKTFFFTCARNAALMLLRKKVRQFEELKDEHQSSAKSPEQEARLIQLRRVLLDEIRLLTPRRREAALEMLAGHPARGAAKKAARFLARHDLKSRLNREAF